MFLHLPAFLPLGGSGAPKNRSFFSPVFGSSVGGGFRNGGKTYDERDERRNDAKPNFLANKCQSLLWLIFTAKVLCILAKKGSPSCFPQVISFHTAGAWAVSLSLSTLPLTFAHLKVLLSADAQSHGWHCGSLDFAKGMFVFFSPLPSLGAPMKEPIYPETT